LLTISGLFQLLSKQPRIVRSHAGIGLKSTIEDFQYFGEMFQVSYQAIKLFHIPVKV